MKIPFPKKGNEWFLHNPFIKTLSVDGQRSTSGRHAAQALFFVLNGRKAREDGRYVPAYLGRMRNMDRILLVTLVDYGIEYLQAASAASSTEVLFEKATRRLSPLRIIVFIMIGVELVRVTLGHFLG